MSGYKPGYSEEHSPTHKLGLADGQRDAELVSSCPSIAPIGPDADGGAMYKRGYDDGFGQAKPHICTGSCQK